MSSNTSTLTPTGSFNRLIILDFDMSQRFNRIFLRRQLFIADRATGIEMRFFLASGMLKNVLHMFMLGNNDIRKIGGICIRQPTATVGKNQFASHI